jgi:hypothetical protein
MGCRVHIMDNRCQGQGVGNDKGVPTSMKLPPPPAVLVELALFLHKNTCLEVGPPRPVLVKLAGATFTGG